MRIKTLIRPYSLVIQWITHAFLIWFLLNLNDALFYWFEVQKNGYFIFHSDGTQYTQWDRFINHNYHQGIWAVVLVGTGLVEVNYHLFFHRGSLRYFLGSSILLGIVFQVFLFLFNQWKLQTEPQLTVGPCLVFMLYTWMYALLRNLVQQRMDQSEQRIQHSEAEVQALKAQINPHFFFNTLNSIYGTALHEQADQTAESIEQLSGLMRYTLQQMHQKYVPVREEIEFIRDYLQLQQVRIPIIDTIRMEIRITFDEQPAFVAPLLLIPFIENAFRYGISIDHACFLSLHLTVENSRLTFILENSLLPGIEKLKGQGIGLNNVRKRLSLLYPHTHQLIIHNKLDCHRVELFIQLHSNS